MIEPNLVFDRIQAGLQKLLEPRQFRLVDQHAWPEASGSRDATFSGEKGLVRLSWDGQEQYFILERSTQPGEDDWEELSLEFFDPKEADQEWVTDIVNGFHAAVEGYLKQG